MRRLRCAERHSITSHLGPPVEGEFKSADSLAPVARRLGQLMQREIPLLAITAAFAHSKRLLVAIANTFMLAAGLKISKNLERPSGLALANLAVYLGAHKARPRGEV